MTVAPAFTPAFGTGVHDDLRPDAPRDDVVRAIAALPGEMRLHALRIVMYLSMRHLDRDAAMRAGCAAGFQRAFEGMDAILGLVRDADARAGLHPLAATLIARAADARPDAAAVIGRFHEEARSCGARLDEDDGAGAHASLERLSRLGNVDCVAEFAGLGHAIARCTEDWRAEAAAQARDAQRSAMDARDRIEGIARTVRLISLNARVEAARAGDAGRAFGVIAEEIKDLSEQTETASAEMGEGIEAILAQGGAT